MFPFDGGGWTGENDPRGFDLGLDDLRGNRIGRGYRPGGKLAREGGGVEIGLIPRVPQKLLLRIVYIFVKNFND